MDATGLTHDQQARLVGVFWDSNDYRGREALTSPEELHQFAWNYNWDDGLEQPRWIVEHPSCDRGTALLVYWRAGPRWYSQYASRDEVPPEDVSYREFLAQLEQRYLSGTFRSGRIRFDPANDDGTDWTSCYPDIPQRRTIPERCSDPRQERR